MSSKPKKRRAREQTAEDCYRLIDNAAGEMILDAERVARGTDALFTLLEAEGFPPKFIALVLCARAVTALRECGFSEAWVTARVHESFSCDQTELRRRTSERLQRAAFEQDPPKAKA